MNTEKMNKDLQQFIEVPMPNKRSSGNILSPNRTQRKMINQSVATSKLRKTESLDRIDEVNPQQWLDSQLGVDEQQSVQSNSQATVIQNMDVTVAQHLMHHTFTTIISNKKELMEKFEIMSQTDSKHASLDRFSTTSPEVFERHEKYKSLLQQSSLHVKSGTITQNSQVYSYLQRIPPRQDENNLPEYLSNPITAAISRQLSPDDQSLIQPSMRIAVDINRSSDLEMNRTQNSPRLLDQAIKQQQVVAVADQTNSSKVSPKPLSPRCKAGQKTTAIAQSQDDMGGGLVTQTSFNNSKFRTINFQRGANGPHTNVVQIKPDQTTNSKKIIGQEGKSISATRDDSQPNLRLTKGGLKVNSKDEELNATLSKQSVAMFSPSKSINSNPKFRNTRSTNRPPQHPVKRRPQDQGIIIQGSGQIVLDQEQQQLISGHKVQNKKLRSMLPNHSPLRPRNQQASAAPEGQKINQMLNKQFTDIFNKLNEQVMRQKQSFQQRTNTYIVPEQQIQKKASEKFVQIQSPVREQQNRSPVHQQQDFTNKAKLSAQLRVKQRNSPGTKDESEAKFAIWPVLDQSEDHAISTQERNSLNSSNHTLHKESPRDNSKKKTIELKELSGKKQDSDVPRLNFRQIIENENRSKVQHGGIMYTSPKFTIDESQDRNLGTMLRKSDLKNERPNSQNSIQQQVDTIDMIQFENSQKGKHLNSMPSAHSSTKLINESPDQTALSRTLTPMNKNQNSNKTIGLGSSLEELPHQMARTFVSTSGQTSGTKLHISNKHNEVVVEDHHNQGQQCKCTCPNHHKNHSKQQDLYRTQLNFSSQAGSELRGWEMPKNINITLQSTMGNSTFDQTMYNSNASQGKGNGFGFQTTQQMGQGAIRIEHSPSMNMIYAKSPKASHMHIHKKTQQRAIEARTISLDPTMTMSDLYNKEGVPTRKQRPFMNANRVNLLQMISSTVGTPPRILSPETNSSHFNSTQQVFASMDVDTPSRNEAYAKGANYRKRNNISNLMQSQEVASTNTVFEYNGGKKSPFMSITKDQERQFKLQQKRSLMQLPRLPIQVLNQVNLNEEDSSEQTMNMMSTRQTRRFNQTISPTMHQQYQSATQQQQMISAKPQGNKFVSQSSSIRQNQLLKVQKDKSTARLQLHMKRFERLYNKNGGPNSRTHRDILQMPQGGQQFQNANTAELFKIGRMNGNIMMHSPLPSTFVQSPPPSMQTQEKLMSNLIKQIVETGGSTQKSRTMLAQENIINAKRQMKETIHIPTTTQTLNNF